MRATPLIIGKILPKGSTSSLSVSVSGLLFFGLIIETFITLILTYCPRGSEYIEWIKKI